MLARPSVTLPKGGGAIAGIGEKFTANPVTGTGSLAVPIAVTPSRAGFVPELSLAYDSGAGNSAFGLGWNVAIGSVRRKTDKGLPQYRDGNRIGDEDSDTFVLSGVEDLVPWRDADGYEPQVPDGIVDGEGYYRRRYRPRIEGGFARIERWTRGSDGRTHWRTVSRDNVTHVYGLSDHARVTDPRNPYHVFEWLLEEARDERGNLIRYEYKQDLDRVGAPRIVFEASRQRAGFAPTYHFPKRVRYGNKVAEPTTDDDWSFMVVFDYGEHSEDDPSDAEITTWPPREDPFSSWRSGFERRCYRLCRRVLMLHRFDELAEGAWTVVRSTDLQHDSSEVVTTLTGVTQRGWMLHDDGTWATDALPSLLLQYSQATFGDTLGSFVGLTDLPGGVDPARMQWVDLDGEGLPGLLTEVNGGWYYKRNNGNARLGPLHKLPQQPTLPLSRARLMDIDGNGRMDLVHLDRPHAGFQPRREDGTWETFQPFRSLPTEDLQGPDVRRIDLTGDGIADLLVTEDQVFRWYPSEEDSGWGLPEEVAKPHDERDGPLLVFSNEYEAIFLADMSGDGLTDLVRVRNRGVHYWPNCGYGRFGARITIARSPFIGHEDEFDPRRVRLADVDGTGTADLMYVGPTRVRLWPNRSGNSFGDAVVVPRLRSLADPSSVQVTDVFGDGTACLLWSSTLPGDRRAPLRYMRLMAEGKPYLLTGIDNQMGRTVEMTYQPSTSWYLADREAGTPWATRLAFPVHCLESVTSADAVTGWTFVSRYAYHHGYFDGPEREFRGFGMVEQWDTETLPDYEEHDPDPDQLLHYVPPIHTKTWFHTGSWRKRPILEQAYAAEYFDGDTDPGAAGLPSTMIPLSSTPQGHREALRALKGQTLRQEVYADDDSDLAGVPYTVAEHSFQLRQLQPCVNDQHGVYQVIPSETVQRTYEREATDPRTSHTLTLEADEYGSVTRSAAVSYPRRAAHQDESLPEQAATAIVISETDYIHQDDRDDAYHIGVPCTQRSYELGGLQPTVDAGHFSLQEMRAAVEGSTEIPFEQDCTGQILEKRQLGEQRTTFWDDELDGPLGLGELGSRALPYERIQLGLTPGLIEQVYEGRITADMLGLEGGYQDPDGDSAAWMPSGREEMDPDRFYIPTAHLDPWGNRAEVTWDAYFLSITSVTDPVGNTTSAEVDYRVMQPWRVTGPNGNSAAARFDALGRVTATAVMGREGEGDTLEDPTAEITYETHRWTEQGLPNRVYTRTRETHADPNTRWLLSYAYSDGGGNVVMTKAQAEPGLAYYVDDQGQLQQTEADPRWVGSGRTVLDNKGNPVKQYEPYFSTTEEYESEAQLVQWGVTPVLYYDPLGRNVRTDFPDGTFSSVEFDAWSQSTYDQNDNVVFYDEEGLPQETNWYAERMALPVGDPARVAAEKAYAHHDTPTMAHLDALGRVFLTRADNGSHGAPDYCDTRLTLDIQGNPRVVHDAEGRDIQIQTFDLLSRALHTDNADGGVDLAFADVAGQPLWTWRGSDQVKHQQYDGLRRPSHLWVQVGEEDERLQQRMLYGESLPTDEALASNLLGQPYRTYAGAGLESVDGYDFKGNALAANQRMLVEVDTQVDWTPLASILDAAAIEAAAETSLQAEDFVSSTTFDALDRVVTNTTPDASVTHLSYNEAGLLEAESINVRGAATSTPAVVGISYNARGQRESIEYGNGTSTTYEYDPNTFRLVHLVTTRASDGARLQDLTYTYDPVGNITQITDAAQQDVYFQNQVVSPTATYTYDAIYRLIEAAGREHGSMNVVDFNDYGGYAAGLLPHPNDASSLRAYTEQYAYDKVGNFLDVHHSEAGGSAWTREYEYAAGSNRLERTSVSPGVWATYSHDERGNMVSMPHLSVISPDYRDQIRTVEFPNGDMDVYHYDSGGERVRKVQRRGSVTRERLYLGGWEVYREYDGVNPDPQIERETLHVQDDARKVALFETQTVGGATPPNTLQRFQLDNHLSTVCVETDDVGAVITYEEYHPYGSTAWKARSSSTEVSEKRYRYTGKEKDEGTGLYYHGARYYVCWIGRWSSADPAGLSDGVNIYRYTLNNPVGSKDPTGEATIRIARPDFSVSRTLASESDDDGQQFWEPPAIQPSNKGGVFESDVSAVQPIMFSDSGRDALSAGEGMKQPVSTRRYRRLPSGFTLSSATTAYSGYTRLLYERDIKSAARNAEAIVRRARALGDVSMAEFGAKGASEFRTYRRTLTQSRLPLGYREISEYAEKPLSWSELLSKYEGDDAFSTYKGIASASGRSRWYMSWAGRFSRLLGPVGVSVGIGVSYHNVSSAPEEERGRVAAGEVGLNIGVSFGGMGFSAGGAFLIGGVFLFPPSWVMIGGIGAGILGAGIGGWLGKKLMESWYDLWQQDSEHRRLINEGYGSTICWD